MMPVYSVQQERLQMTNDPSSRNSSQSGTKASWFLGRRVRANLEHVDHAITGALRFPLLMIQLLILMLVAWGGLGAGLGFDDLFWYHAPVSVGIATSLLIGQILALR